MRQLRLYFCYRFDASVLNSLTLSITYVGCHLVFIDDFKVYCYCVFAGDLWISRDIAFLTIPCVSHDSIFAFNSIRQLSLSIHWWFQGLQLLYFRRRFMDQLWHNVFENSMCQQWLYFSYRFDVSVVNSVTLLIPYGSCHSVFMDHFKFNKDSVFADDLWISSDITFLIIPCVSHDSSFAIDLMRRSSIHLLCRFHTSVVTQFSLTISMSIETQFSLTIYESAVT
jgi:hypothetical protein